MLNSAGGKCFKQMEFFASYTHFCDNQQIFSMIVVIYTECLRSLPENGVEKFPKNVFLGWGQILLLFKLCVDFLR